MSYLQKRRRVNNTYMNTHREEDWSRRHFRRGGKEGSGRVNDGDR